MGIFARKSYCKNKSQLETHLGSREREERGVGQHKGPRGKIQAGIEPGDSGAVWEDGSDRHNLLLTSSLPAHAKPDRSSSLYGVAGKHLEPPHLEVWINTYYTC